MLVPKTQLNQFFEHDADIKVLYELVKKDLVAHPQDPVIRKLAVDFFEEAVEEDPTLAPRALKLAWRMKEDNLFRVASQAGAHRNIDRRGVVHALVGIIKKSPEGPIDWDKRYVLLERAIGYT